MSSASQDSESSQSSSGYEDGLGRRVLAFDRETGEMLERLVLRPELSAFEEALRKRITTVAELEDERFARPRGLERDANDRLTVISEYVAGRRLTDVLDAAAEYGIVAGLDAGLGLLLELLPALARLHDAGLAHGALAAGRVMVTPAGQLVLLDSIYADPLERLKLTRRRLWSELRLAFPSSAGGARFDKGADLGHAAMIAAALSVGRPLRDDDYPDGLPALRQEIAEIASIRGSKAFATGVDKIFAGMLPLAGRRATVSADEAAIDLRKLIRKELGITTCRNALLEFFQQVETAEVERIASDAQHARVEAERVAAQAAETARLEAERAEAERIERERAEQARIENERLERERAEAARAEAERIERERTAAENARIEAERIERERAAAEQARFEAERIERERLAAEQARLEAERIERERTAAEQARFEAERIVRERTAAEQARFEAERIERERSAAEQARLEAERLERERVAAEQARLEAERLERERVAAEQARLEAERLERERIAAEQARLEAERLERERIAAEQARLEAERLERERIAAEQARLEAERLERERVAAEQARLEAERIAAEKARLEAERIERERIAAEQARLEAERLERERLERERLERERAEQARLEAERIERERVAAEKARLEAERIERERIAAEKARLEAERLERERVAAEKARLEAERIERERVEKARVEAERLERERIAAEKARLEAERLERERVAAEKARLEAERIERERVEQARVEAERLERERLEAERRERVAKERAEKARLEAERAEKARLEAERLAEEHAAAERRERELLEAARAERERAEKARQEAERLERERVEHARLEAEREEQEEARERAERARIEAERVAAEEREQALARERQREHEETAARAIAPPESHPAAKQEEPPAISAEAPAPAASTGWLIPPGRAAKFDQPVASAPPPAPIARSYPIYVPPSEPESWTQEMPPSASVPKPELAEVSLGLSAPSPPSTPAFQGPTTAPIKFKDEPTSGIFSSRAPSERHEPESISAAGAYGPFATHKAPQPLPWKLIAAGVVLIAVTVAIRFGYTPSDTPIMQVVRQVAPAPAAKQDPPPVSGTAGALTITTQPPGARVSIDGKPAGETPLTLETIKPGRHVVTVVSPSGTSAKRTVRVEAGRTLTIDVPLFSGFANISAPFIVDISENGKVLGTNVEQIILSPGSHTLRISNKELGYVATETVDVQSGEVTRISVDPRGRANINAVPWAEVWIDGEKAGETPLANVAVRLGIREFVFKNPQFGERKVVVLVTANATASVSADFRK